jgi:hypothetical protein
MIDISPRRLHVSNQLHMSPLSPVHTTHWETFPLGPFNPPRLWVGLWQLSSTAWGSAPASKIREAMARHVDQGYTAFGKGAVVMGFLSFADLALCGTIDRYGESSGVFASLSVLRCTDAAQLYYCTKGENTFKIEPHTVFRRSSPPSTS